MSFYHIAAFVEGKVSNIDEVKTILADHIILLFEEPGLLASYNEYDFLDGNRISIPFGRAIKLFDLEKEILQKIGETASLVDHLEAIFAERFKKSKLDVDDFYNWLEESVPYVSTLDLLSSIVDSEIIVDGTIGASQRLFFACSVKLPEYTIEISEKFAPIKNDEELKLKKFAHRVSIELGEDSWIQDGEFDFDIMEDLLSSLIDEVSANTRIPIEWVSIKASQEDYNYELQVRGVEKTLNVDFKYKGPENKRLRAEKHFRLYASVRQDDHELWSGVDPVELKKFLNYWCVTELQVCLDQMGLPSVSISDERMERWEVEISKADKELPEEDHPNYTNELIRIVLPLAENGNPLAQSAIGVCYLEREDDGQDTDKAIEWFQMSARNGYAGAARDLQRMFLLGLYGIEKDPVRARKWDAFAIVLDAMYC